MYHTFETYNNTHETVPRSGAQSNCTIAGDVLCDTHADPGIGGSDVNASCQYTGSAKDSLGNSYTPPTTNLMTYGRFECRSVFTAQQRGRMHGFITTNVPLLSTVAEDNIILTYTANNFGTYVYGARNTVTTNLFRNENTAIAYLSAGSYVVLNPGTTLSPTANGLTNIRTSSICQ